MIGILTHLPAVINSYLAERGLRYDTDEEPHCYGFFRLLRRHNKCIYVTTA